MELKRALLALALLLCPVAGQAQIQTQSTVQPNVPAVGAIVEQSGPSFRANFQAAINDINYLLQNPGIRPFPGCVAIQVTACGLQSTWGPAYVPFDVAGIVTVDTVQGGLDINGTFGFIALYQGKGQLHNYPGWALTLNNDNNLYLFYSPVGFLAPISFTGSISGTTLTVTSIPFVQPLGIGHVLSGAGVTGGTTIVSQLTGAQGFNGTYQVSVAQTVGSETINANPGQPLVISQKWTPTNTLIGGNGTYPNNGSVGVLNVNAGSNNNIEVMGSTVSNTSLDFYYNGPVFFWQILDPANNAGDTVAIDMRGNNTNKNSFAAVIGQVATSTPSAITGRLSYQVANNTTYANQQALTVNPTYVQFGSNASTFVAQVPEHVATAQLTKPTVTTCGTGSVANGSTDTAGQVTATGAVACTMVFNASYTSQPFCSATDNTNAVGLKLVYNTGVSVTISGLTSGDTFTYHCFAQAGG